MWRDVGPVRLVWVSRWVKNVDVGVPRALGQLGGVKLGVGRHALAADQSRREHKPEDIVCLFRMHRFAGVSQSESTVKRQRS
jgi:hypothetical protein